MLNLNLSKYPKNNQLRDNYYEKLLANYDTLNQYKNLFERDLHKIQSNNKISDPNYISLGASIDQIKETLGHPFHCHTNPCLPKDLTLYLYKKKLGTLKVKIELHFFRGALFYFKYIFSHFAKDEKSLLINVLRSKYFNNQAFINGFEAQDSNADTIFINDNVDFNIHYLMNEESNLIRQFTSLLYQYNIRKLQTQKTQEILFNKL